MNHAFSYKHPRRRRLRYVSFKAESFEEALRQVPKEIQGGYQLYGPA